MMMEGLLLGLCLAHSCHNYFSFHYCCAISIKPLNPKEKNHVFSSSILLHFKLALQSECTKNLLQTLFLCNFSTNKCAQSLPLLHIYRGNRSIHTLQNLISQPQPEKLVEILTNICIRKMSKKCLEKCLKMQSENTSDNVHMMDLKNTGFKTGGGTCNFLATPLAAPKFTSTK